MKTKKRKLKTFKGLKDYTYLGCPLTRNRTAWCYRLCLPDNAGNGQCGRVAPHSLKSAIQIGIEKHNQKLQITHFEDLEKLYLKKLNKFFNPGIWISEGESEIVISIQKQICHVDGSVFGSVCSSLLQDAAALAVNTKIPRFFVQAEYFNSYLTNNIAYNQLVARARYLNMSGDQYVAEAVITDSNKKEIARGSGIFIKSNISLDSEISFY